jgi:hypothetical protein
MKPERSASRSMAHHGSDVRGPADVPVKVEGGMVGDQLAPAADHLIAQMLAVMDREDWRRRAASAGPPHVMANYTWDRIAQRLVEILF